MLIMYESVKFVCEFFFTNFWHWLGLVIVAAAFSHKITINKKS